MRQLTHWDASESLSAFQNRRQTNIPFIRSIMAGVAAQLGLRISMAEVGAALRAMLRIIVASGAQLMRQMHPNVSTLINRDAAGGIHEARNRSATGA
jgi:hypothetical protein